MVIGMFTGWSGHAVPLHTPREPRVEKEAGPPVLVSDTTGEVVYSMRPGPQHTIVMTVVSSEVCLRKRIQGTGHVEVDVEREGERLRVRTEDMKLAVALGSRTVRLDLARVTHDDLMRLRTRLAPSGTVHALRTLATAVDETESDTAERLSLRLTGALVAQFAGEPGAARRLSRELHARYGPQLRRTRRHVAREWLGYQKQVVRACAELQLGIAGLTFWDPARNACALRWLIQMESAWYSYVTASASWRSQI